VVEGRVRKNVSINARKAGREVCCEEGSTEDLKKNESSVRDGTSTEPKVGGGENVYRNRY